MRLNQQSKNVIKKILQIVILIALAAFLTVKLRKDWNTLKNYEWNVQIQFLIISFFSLIVVYLCIIKIWHLILMRLDVQLSYKKAVMIWFRTSIMKYLPGRIWNILGMILIAEREGISKTKVLLSGFVNQIFSLVSATAFSILYLHFSSEDYAISLKYLFYLLPALTIFCFPPILKKLIVIFTKKKGISNNSISINGYSSLVLYFSYVGVWILYGIAFLFFTLSFVKFPVGKSYVIVSVFILSHILGFLSMITPGGIGVREGILTYLLNFHFPISIAIVVSISSRLLLIAADALLFGASYLIKK